MTEKGQGEESGQQAAGSPPSGDQPTGTDTTAGGPTGALVPPPGPASPGSSDAAGGSTGGTVTPWGTEEERQAAREHMAERERIRAEEAELTRKILAGESTTAPDAGATQAASPGASSVAPPPGPSAPSDVKLHTGATLTRDANGTITTTGIDGSALTYSPVDGSWTDSSGRSRRIDSIRVEDLDKSAQDWEELADHLARSSADTRNEIRRARERGDDGDVEDMEQDLASQRARERMARDNAARMRSGPGGGDAATTS